MKFRTLLTSVAAAAVCCFTLGCPPAEDTGVTEEVNLEIVEGDDTTDAGEMMGEMTGDEAAPAVGEVKEGGE